MPKPPFLFLDQIFPFCCRRQLRRTESQYSKLRGLLRGVREELAAKDEGKAVTQEEFESLRHKYDRAKAKVCFFFAKKHALGR